MPLHGSSMFHRAPMSISGFATRFANSVPLGLKIKSRFIRHKWDRNFIAFQWSRANCMPMHGISMFLRVPMGISWFATRFANSVPIGLKMNSRSNGHKWVRISFREFSSTWTENDSSRDVSVIVFSLSIVVEK